MSAAAASAFPGRQHGGIRSAAARTASYQEPTHRQPDTVTLGHSDTRTQTDGGVWEWEWPPELATIPSALPPAPTAPPTAQSTTVPPPPPAPALPSLAGAVVFLGPSADPDAASALSAIGATVVEVPADPTTAHGAEIIGAAAAIARTMPTPT